MIRLLIPVISVLIYCVPTLLAVLPILLAGTLASKILFVALSPIAFALSFILTAGLLSKPFQHAIRKGKFARDLGDKVYGPRRLYGLCWTSVFYFSPLYAAILAIPFTKKLLFKLFGLKGSTNFIVYADTWIRDLPVLRIAEGAYLANKATIGTNMCLNDGSILVDKVTIEKNAMVGHMVQIGPGATLMESSELAVNVGFGIRSRLGKNSVVNVHSSINHGCIIGNNVDIGWSSYIGLRCKIADNIKLPAGINLPAGTEILSQEDLNNFVNKQANMLNIIKDELLKSFLADPIGEPEKIQAS